MNTNDNLESDFTTFSLSPESRDYLVSSAKWAKIIGIVGLISIVLGVLGMIAFVFIGGLFHGSTGGDNTMELIMGAYCVLVLGVLIVSCIPFYLLYKFATETNASLIEFKGVPLEKGIIYLKSFFKTTVLLILTIIALYMIAVVVMVNYTAY